MTAPLACQGGWCSIRAGCSHYLSSDRREPADRICAKGKDGFDAEAPIIIYAEPGSWTKTQARHEWHDPLTGAGQ